MIDVIKKDGTRETFDEQKIVRAVGKSAERVMITLTEEQNRQICDLVMETINARSLHEVEIADLHHIVECALDKVDSRIARCYREYRNYKQDFVHMLDEVYKKSQAIRYIGDRNNANTDSALVSTQRSLIYSELNSELYKKFFLNTKELEAMKDGYIYIHDRSARLDSLNCCLADITAILLGGFEMGNVWYNEPKSLDVAFDVISDVAITMAAMQYGGYTMPRVDTILAPYAEMSYQKYLAEYKDIEDSIKDHRGYNEQKAHEYAVKKVRRDFVQGFQAWEYRFNTVGSSRGDYPFVAVSFGIGQSVWEQMATEVCLEVRREGQGKPGYKKPVLFPKLTFLYDENLHGPGKPLEYLFDCAIECSRKCMYPDFLSLTGEGYIPSMYKKYGKVVSLMGCRASLSPWYERGGMTPADEDDQPVFEGRFNLGAISLHLPMILAKARQESKDFYEVLDYYLEMIRNLHKKTYDFLGEKKASINPLGFCEGGFYGGHLKPEDKIRPLLPPMTMSFGITALNELQELYNGKSIIEDGNFALEVMEYINKKIVEFKEKDHILYAIYGTPAESLCFTGETLVQTYDGDKAIQNIKPGDLVYSFNEKEKKIELKPVIFSGMTKRNAVIAKVTFDNGQIICCTPDHPFAVRIHRRDVKTGRFLKEGEEIQYIKASELKKDMSIKSNYVSVAKQTGRATCSSYHGGRRQLIQDINAEYFYGPKPINHVVHHIDGNKLNNQKENLEYMVDGDHRRLHMPDTIASFCKTSASQTGKNNSFYGKHHTGESKLANRLAHIQGGVVAMDMNGRLVKEYECITDTEKDGYSSASVRITCRGKKKTHEYRGLLWFYENDIPDELEMNHKIESVEILQELCDVYDIEVAENHNFYVGGNKGILVHNCGLQVDQFRKKYGIIHGVSDRPYVSNSFHCGVWEDITPIEKQDSEARFWDLFNGGKIQYCRYPIDYNVEAIKTLVRRAMDKGFYEGINLSLAYCEECGHQELDMDECPKCGSKLITKIDRMNGYLGYTRVHGETRYNDAKNAEIRERKSM